MFHINMYRGTQDHTTYTDFRDRSENLTFFAASTCGGTRDFYISRRQTACSLGRSVVQRHILYLGEINDSQRAAWQKAIDVFDEHDGQPCQCALFPHDRTRPPRSRPPCRSDLFGATFDVLLYDLTGNASKKSSSKTSPATKGWRNSAGRVTGTDAPWPAWSKPPWTPLAN